MISPNILCMRLTPPIYSEKKRVELVDYVHLAILFLAIFTHRIEIIAVFLKLDSTHKSTGIAFGNDDSDKNPISWVNLITEKSNWIHM